MVARAYGKPDKKQTLTAQTATTSSQVLYFEEYQCFSLMVKVLNSVALDVNITVETTLDVEDASSWTTITNSDQQFTADGAYVWSFGSAGYPYVRIKFTFTAGTSDFEIWTYGKGE